MPRCPTARASNRSCSWARARRGGRQTSWPRSRRAPRRCRSSSHRASVPRVRRRVDRRSSGWAPTRSTSTTRGATRHRCAARARRARRDGGGRAERPRRAWDWSPTSRRRSTTPSRSCTTGATRCSPTRRPTSTSPSSRVASVGCCPSCTAKASSAAWRPSAGSSSATSTRRSPAFCRRAARARARRDRRLGPARRPHPPGVLRGRAAPRLRGRRQVAAGSPRSTRCSRSPSSAVHHVAAVGRGRLAQLLDLAYVGDALSLHLAFQEDLDPGPAPALDLALTGRTRAVPRAAAWRYRCQRTPARLDSSVLTGDTPCDCTRDFKVADLSLAGFGRKEIQLAEHEMPGLMAAARPSTPTRSRSPAPASPARCT